MNDTAEKEKKKIQRTSSRDRMFIGITLSSMSGVVKNEFNSGRKTLAYQVVIQCNNQHGTSIDPEHGIFAVRSAARAIGIGHMISLSLNGLPAKEKAKEDDAGIQSKQEGESLELSRNSVRQILELNASQVQLTHDEIHKLGATVKGLQVVIHDLKTKIDMIAEWIKG